jgi:hypothetical protein
VAGYNCRVDIFRISYQSDDIVGGAVVSGTLQFQNVLARFEADPEEQLILQQGLQTVRTYTMTCIPGTMDIRERDELEVTRPTDHVYYGKRFRIVGVRHSDFNRRDPRNYLILRLTRDVRAHTRQ